MKIKSLFYSKKISSDKKNYATVKIYYILCFPFLKTVTKDFEEKYYFFKFCVFKKTFYANLADYLLKNIDRIVRKRVDSLFLNRVTFSKYKNINEGKNAIVLATGPSLKYFNNDIEGVVLGVNSAFKFFNKLDYLFLQDFSGMSGYIYDVPKIVPTTCKKFYGYVGVSSLSTNSLIPDTIAQQHQAERYYLDTSFSPVNEKDNSFALDLSYEPLKDYGSVIFPAMQFLLYTRPKKIYLVGCDCSEGHFDGTRIDNQNGSMRHIIKGWSLLKDFVKHYYPDIEIISVNPVGLKGMFKDIYTDSFKGSPIYHKADL